MYYKFTLSTFIFILFSGFTEMAAQDIVKITEQRAGSRESQNIIYFTPSIDPDVAEIKDATNEAFFSAVSDSYVNNRNRRMVRVDMPVTYEDADRNTIREICINNNATHAVIPHVKFFKVGLGQFVFSSQVVVSMKLYDADGNFISESSYDTFRKNARIMGSAQNSIRIGTNGVLKQLTQNMKRKK